MKTVSTKRKHGLRLLLAPEPILAVTNVLLLAYLFVDEVRGVETLHDVFLRGIELLPFPLSRSITDMFFGVLLAPVLLPLTFFVIMPMVFLNVSRGGFGMVLVYATFIPNGVLWGECTMYFYRLIRTGSHRLARRRMFSWWRRGQTDVGSTIESSSAVESCGDSTIE